jgi:hypothetical protein
MKRLILQHYTGTPGELELLSMRNIQDFAKREAADYLFLEGNVFAEGLSAPMQKLAMLDERFDSYDVVVMLDMDMFVRKGLQESLFDQPGIGVSGYSQRRLKWRHLRKFSGLVHWRYPYWNGSLWKLDRWHRQTFRSKLDLVELSRYSAGELEDEGVMHQLARHNHFHSGILPGGEKWAMSSWWPNLEEGAMYHIRPRVSKNGPVRPKLENLRKIADMGLIEI